MTKFFSVISKTFRSVTENKLAVILYVECVRARLSTLMSLKGGA